MQKINKRSKGNEKRSAPKAFCFGRAWLCRGYRPGLQAAQEDELAGEGGGDAQGDASGKLGGAHAQNIAGVIKGYFVIPA